MDDALLTGKKLVFVVGSPRSGTTWLRMLLAQAPAVAASRATHLYINYLRSFIDSYKLFEGSNAGLSDIVSEDEMATWARDFSALCFFRIGTKKPDASIILEKTPGHALCGVDINRLFPKSYFIHVIRDPRAVVTSLRAASRSWGAKWSPSRIIDASATWEEHVRRAREVSGLTARYREVYYESLHERGAEELAGLFQWLDEPLEPGQAEEYWETCEIDKIRHRAKSARKLRQLDRQFFRRGEVDSWRRELSGSDIAIIERLTRKQMAALGYESVAGRRDRMIAKARLKAYCAADKFAKTVRAGADRIKP